MSYLFEQYANLWISATKGDEGHKILNPRYIVSISHSYSDSESSETLRYDVFEVIDVHGHKHAIRSIGVPKGEQIWSWLRDNRNELSGSMPVGEE